MIFDPNDLPAVFDSRDVIERIAEMSLEYGPEDGDSIDTIHVEKMTDYEQEEWAALVAFRDEAENDTEDWDNGETFVHESYFEAYAEELAHEIGAIDPDVGWPVTHIDWKAAAEELLQDYMSVEFAGVTYYHR